MHHNSGLHHYSARKRIHLKHEAYPHPDPFKRLMDKLVYAASIFTPLMTLPQVYIIWVQKSAAGISVISWIGYFISALIWLIYGFIHREKPIILMNFSWVVLDLAVILGAFLYA